MGQPFNFEIHISKNPVANSRKKSDENKSCGEMKYQEI